MGGSKKILGSGFAAFGADVASRLLSRPTVQSTLRGLMRKLVTGSREKPYREIETVERTAEHIVEILDGKIPRPACIGIEGIAGSGKSTLGRSLSKRLGLKWQTLFARELGAPLDLERGKVYENIRLFRTQDIDAFDVLLYIDVPTDVARRRVLDRDRDGALADVLDFEKLKRLGDLLFDVVAGEEIRIPDSPVRMKIHPKEGFKRDRNLRAMLSASGIEPGDLSAEQMLFRYCYGEPKQGILPYLKLGTYAPDILAGLRVGLLVALDELS